MLWPCCAYGPVRHQNHLFRVRCPRVLLKAPALSLENRAGSLQRFVENIQQYHAYTCWNAVWHCGCWQSSGLSLHHQLLHLLITHSGREYKVPWWTKMMDKVETSYTDVKQLQSLFCSVSAHLDVQNHTYTFKMNYYFSHDLWTLYSFISASWWN